MVDVSFNLNNFEYFILIMIRILSFVTVAPIFGNNAVPRKVKVGLHSIFIIIFQKVLTVMQSFRHFKEYNY